MRSIVIWCIVDYSLRVKVLLSVALSLTELYHHILLLESVLIRAAEGIIVILA